MKSLVKITENIVEKKLSRLGAVQTHILLNWNYIAEHYSNITIPDKIKFNRNKNTDGQITIKVQNGFGPEIQHAIPFLLNQINSRFGYKAITKIKIIQSELGYIKKRESNFILRFLAEKFNIKISRYNKRKPAFPSRLWFKEKFRKQKS